MNVSNQQRLAQGEGEIQTIDIILFKSCAQMNKFLNLNYFFSPFLQQH